MSEKDKIALALHYLSMLCYYGDTNNDHTNKRLEFMTKIDNILKSMPPLSISIEFYFTRLYSELHYYFNKEGK